MNLEDSNYVMKAEEDGLVHLDSKLLNDGASEGSQEIGNLVD